MSSAATAEYRAADAEEADQLEELLQKFDAYMDDGKNSARVRKESAMFVRTLHKRCGRTIACFAGDAFQAWAEAQAPDMFIRKNAKATLRRWSGFWKMELRREPEGPVTAQPAAAVDGKPAPEEKLSPAKPEKAAGTEASQPSSVGTADAAGVAQTAPSDGANNLGHSVEVNGTKEPAAKSADGTASAEDEQQLFEFLKAKKAEELPAESPAKKRKKDEKKDKKDNAEKNSKKAKKEKKEDTTSVPAAAADQPPEDIVAETDTEYPSVDFSTVPSEICIVRSGHAQIDGLFKRLPRPSRGRPAYQKPVNDRHLFLCWRKDKWYIGKDLSQIKRPWAEVDDVGLAHPCEPYPREWRVAESLKPHKKNQKDSGKSKKLTLVRRFNMRLVDGALVEELSSAERAILNAPIVRKKQGRTAVDADSTGKVAKDDQPVEEGKKKDNAEPEEEAEAKADGVKEDEEDDKAGGENAGNEESEEASDSDSSESDSDSSAEEAAKKVDEQPAPEQNKEPAEKESRETAETTKEGAEKAAAPNRNLLLAVEAVQNALQNTSAMDSEWTSLASDLIKVSSDPAVQRILAKHGWGGNQFKGPLDRKRLLDDLNAEAKGEPTPKQKAGAAPAPEDREQKSMKTAQAFEAKCRKELEGVPPRMRLRKLESIKKVAHDARTGARVNPTLQAILPHHFSAMMNRLESELQQERAEGESSSTALWPASVAADAQDDEARFPHRTHRPERSMLRSRRRSREEIAAAGRHIQLGPDRHGYRRETRIASHRSLNDLWYQMPGATVVCDGCEMTVAQNMGSLQGQSDRSQFAQDQFLCAQCMGIHLPMGYG